MLRPSGPELAFEIGLDAADDHVGQFGDRVQHFFIDGWASVISIAAQIRQASVGEQLRLPVPAQAAGNADERNHSVVGLGGALLR